MEPIPSITPATQRTPGDEPSTPADGEAAPVKLSLTDFLDVATLQEIQDSFTAVAGLQTIIRDAEGDALTVPTDFRQRAESDAALDWLLEGDDAAAEGGYSAPIQVEGQTLGSLAIYEEDAERADTLARTRLRQALTRMEIPEGKLDAILETVEWCYRPQRAAAVQFLYMLANSIARLCYQEYQLRQRVDELSTLYRLSTLLAGSRDLQEVLNIAASSATRAMGVKSASIRMLDPSGKELVPRAVHNLSAEYMEKGPIVVERSEIYRNALRGEVVYVPEMRSDPRTLYPEDAEREGLVSMLFCGIIYKGRPLGVIQLGTAERRTFSSFEKSLIQAIAQIVATAIENARLDLEWHESQRVQRQLQLAADVQRRMLPSKMPQVEPFELAARYVPSFELGGDFYDFVPLDGHLGVAVGDVVGKGVAASLLMASVRSSLRAFAQDLYDIDQIMARVNATMCSDTKTNEFATVFYGVLDPQRMRLTYCSAGHDPTLLLRDGKVVQLDVGGMIIGVDDQQTYDKGLVDLMPGDLIIMYTDGLVDAMDFNQKKFGRERLTNALKECDGKSAQDAINHILWQMRRFTGLNRLVDDTTLVALKVKPDAVVPIGRKRLV